MPKQTSPLAGSTAIVTGSARNIGRAIALALADDGADLVVHARQDRQAAEALAEEVRARGARAVVQLGDLREESVCAALVERAAAELGGLRILVCNAAIRRQKAFLEMSLQEWREVVTTDLDAVFTVCRAAAPQLVAAGGGSIVCLGGSPSHLGSRGRAHVCAAKMGVVGLARVLANELGEHSVNVNVVAPGHIDTARGASAGRMSTVVSERPIARMGEPEEIAAMVRHLCGPRGRYVTGQTIHVNGGMLMA
jgi:3-oxoacyl-[acyl-carrier protein] reductase